MLREMARPYDAERFVALVERLYRRIPQLALSTDIIAGFPGETDAEFQETLDVARACRFAKIHAFPYSPRIGTPAAERADQVPPAFKEAHAAMLRAGRRLRASGAPPRRNRRALRWRRAASLTESSSGCPPRRPPGRAGRGDAGQSVAHRPQTARQERASGLLREDRHGRAMLRTGWSILV
ncbi:MAG: hypothetical protein ACLSVD_09095 [Eggerthellaceae bacterium]